MLTRPLDAVELRVLGALLEKEQTTPEQYPLTLNALQAACNQKSNREPVTDYGEGELASALDRLRAEVLAWRSEGARTERWAHCLDRRWHLDAAGKALMTLLLLRGAQTPGELRTRGERMHAFASVAAVEETLAALAAGPDPLVRELGRRPGQRESRWAHCVGVEGSEVEADADHEAAVDPAQPSPPRRVVAPPAHLMPEALAGRLDALEAQVVELAAALEALRRRLGDLE